MSFLLIPIQIFPNSGFGSRALENASGSVDNVGIGTNALRQINNVGNSNIGIGSYAGERLTSNTGNVIIGSEALKFSTSDYSVAIGFQALKGDSLNFGFHSSTVAIGNEAMGEAFAALSNTAIGNRALRRVNSSENVAIGADAGIGIFRSEKNTFVGAGAGFSHFRGTTVNGVNTFVGWNSGYFVTSGIKNTILGAFGGNQGGLDIRTLSNYIVLSDGDGNPRLWITDTGAVNIPGGISLTGSLTITGGTVTANNPVLSATQTWNNAAVTFTGWQLNVTDTASNAASLLMDLQVGGSSRFNVDKTGAISLPAGSQTSPSIKFPAWGATYWLYASGDPGLAMWAGPVSITAWVLGLPGLSLNGSAYVGWASGNATSAKDLILVRDAANTLAQRNGVNAQTLRVYNTFTDASNYERGIFSWSSNILTIGTENAGTGLARNLEFTVAGGVAARINTARNLLVGTSTDTLGGSGNICAAGGRVSLFSGDPTYGIRLSGTTTVLDSSGSSTVTAAFTTNVEAWNGSVNISTGTGTGVNLRATFDSSGNAVIGSGAIATNATNGFLYVPGCAGTPTGVPTTYTGRVPIVVDTTNNKLYFYSGGAWRDAGP